MLLFIAQLSAPTLQKGPIRLPARPPQEEAADPRKENPPIIQNEIVDPIDQQAGRDSGRGSTSTNITIQTQSLLSDEEIERLTHTCQKEYSSAKNTGDMCAKHVKSYLNSIGYITTQATATAKDGRALININEGKLQEVSISAGGGRLERKIKRLTSPLQGEVLHLPSIQRQLRLLKTIPGVKSIAARLTSINDDIQTAKLAIDVEAGAPAWKGNLSLNNSGNNGSGELTLQGGLLKQNLITQDDSFFVYGKAEGTGEPKLGNLIKSVSYTFPASDSIYITTSGGHSKRKYIEYKSPADDLSNSQLQGQAQVEWVFNESLTHRNSAFVSYSWSGSELRIDGKKLPKAITPDIVSTPESGYIRYGVNSSGMINRMNWNGSVYLLNGISAGIPDNQINELKSIGIKPNEATALSGILSASYQINPEWQLSTRVGGQVAFNNLLPTMQFNIGSDIGLRGLPGQLVSGDSGWMAAAESPVTIWRRNSNSVQVVPFIGAGGVNTDIQSHSINDTAGAGGLFMRWNSGRQWLVEIGWVDSFYTDDNQGEWNNWSLGSGLYANARYAF